MIIIYWLILACGASYDLYYAAHHPDLWTGLGKLNYFIAAILGWLGCAILGWALINTITAKKITTAGDRYKQYMKEKKKCS